MESKKNDTNELEYKTEIDPQTQKTNSWLPEGKCGERNEGVGFNTYTLLYTTQIINKDLLFSTGNFTQNFIISYKGKESEKKRYINGCIIESLCCTPKTNNM